MSHDLRVAFAPRRKAWLLDATKRRFDSLTWDLRQVQGQTFHTNPDHDGCDALTAAMSLGVGHLGDRASDPERAPAARIAYASSYYACMMPGLLVGIFLGGCCCVAGCTEPDKVRIERRLKRTRLRETINIWADRLPPAPGVVKSALAKGDVAVVAELEAFLLSPPLLALKMLKPKNIVPDLVAKIQMS